MWPSNTKVKNTLCETGVIRFRDSNLVLNPKIDLAKTFLDEQLLISAIDATNALFDQKEKLKLAVLLRDYIFSCSDLDELRLNKQDFWKDYYQFLKHSLSEFPLISFLTLILSPLLIPLKWLKLKLSIWSAEKKQIKQRENLHLGIKKSTNQPNMINPLTFDHGLKLFEIPEKKQILEHRNLDVGRLIENLAETTGIFSKRFEKHIGDSSSYELKDHLKEGLERIYFRLNGDFDPILGPLEERMAFINKLYEGINFCSPGFHERVNTLLESFNTLDNFSDLLYSVRKSLIEKTAIEQMQYYNFFRDTGQEIHTYHDFTRIANQEGLGVPLEIDSYRGEMNWEDIRKALHTQFKNNYTLFNLPTLLTESLRGSLIEVGYTGPKLRDSSYTVGTDESEVEKMMQFIKRFLNTDFQTIDWQEFFIIDDYTYNIIDVNWEFIKNLFFKQLTSENYFKACSDEDFNQHLVNLLNHIKTTHNNYFTLLAQLEPKSFNILFYRLEKTQYKELQEKVIGLFFESDETGLSPLQVIAQNNPDILTRFLGFIDSDPCHQATIQALLVKHSDLVVDSLMYSSQKQVQSAFILFNYILQHPEIFKPAFSETCLFSENLAQIQQSLLNLIIRSSDITQANTLLRFLSCFPSTLPQPSKNVVDFLFISLSHLEDKPLITNIINQYSPLLLKNFSINYFKDQNKNLAFITEKLISAYTDELLERRNTGIHYTTQFFNCNFGHSTSEKLTALTVIQAILNTNSNNGKLTQLAKAKSAYPALRNGRLGHLFKACTQDIAITSDIKIQPHI